MVMLKLVTVLCVLVLSVFPGSVLGILAVAPDEPIRIPLSRRLGSQALQKRPRLLAAQAATSGSSSNGLCSNLETSANATECVGFNPSDNGLYFGRISVGADPVQTFNVSLYSASTELWIYSTTANSTQANIWVPTISQSGHDTGTNSSAAYDDGAGEFYELWNETVTFGALTAPGVVVGAADLSANRLTASQINPESSGVLGMGWPDTIPGIQNPPTFIQVAYQQGLIKDQLYGFYAGNEENSTNGELTLGTIDSSRYTGTLNYHNVTKDNGTYRFFDVNVTKLTIEGQTEDYTNGTALNSIIDIGTSFLVLPDNIVEALINAVNGTSISNSETSGGYSVPCENLAKAPAITFEIDNINYTIPGDVWTHQDTSLAEAGVPCFAELYNGGDNFYSSVLGDTFLRQYYTVFDFDNGRVGFAQSVTASKGKKNAVPRTRALVSIAKVAGMALLPLAILLV